MENRKDNSCDIFESNNNSFRITTRSQSRETSSKRKVLWAKDLTEVMGENKTKSHASSTNNISGCFERKITEILMKPCTSKQIKIKW